MKRFYLWFVIPLVLSLLTGFTTTASVSPSVSSSTGVAYTVLVGAERINQGAGLMAYFPGTLHVHVGDSVTWKANANEIHTVTFLAGAPAPHLEINAPPGAPSPVAFNPAVAFPAAPANGLYDGSTFVNSGLMSMEPGSPQTFKLTFTKTGTFHYICLVHGVMMSGTIVVDAASVQNASPAQVSAQALAQIGFWFTKVPAAVAAANALVPPDTHNSDGSVTHHVLLGYNSGPLDLMRFFPSTVVAHPGDTITWMLSPGNVAPHTVTFLNGTPDPSLIVPYNGALVVNPMIFFPANPGHPLTNSGYFNSGFFFPGSPATYSLKVGNFIGNLTFQCLLHDSSGMVGSVHVSLN